MRIALFLFFFLVQHSFAETPLESLVNAERAFSKMSEEKGLKAAFVEFFSDDSVIFKKQWIPGRKYHMDQPESSGLLSWEPRIADISEVGNLGYTTGPYTYRDDDVGHGYYMSIWKKQKDGSWKVVLDQGISTRQPTSMPVDKPIWAPAFGAGRKDVSGTSLIIMEEEKAFAQIVLKKGFAAAYKEKGVEDMLLFRDGHEPATLEIASKFISEQSAHVDSMVAEKAKVSGNLGYAYGVWSSKTQKGGFVRIWKVRPDGSWKIVLDVSFPS